MAQLEVYSHSGRLGVGVLVVPLVGVIVPVLLGIAYSYADVYSPVGGYVSLALVFLFAFGVGYAFYFGAILSKCRNTKFVGIAGFLAGVLALYTSWAAFVFALTQRFSDDPLEYGLADVFFSPGAIWEFAKLVNEEGWYSILGWTPSGIILWLIWITEAGIVMVIVPAVSAMAMSNRVFCETSGRWCELLKNHLRVGLIDEEALLHGVVEGDLDSLAALPPVGKSEAPALQVDLHRTDEPHGTRAMQVKLVKLKEEEKGKVKEETDDLTPIYLLSPEQYERVEALARRIPLDSQLPEGEAAGPEGQTAADAETPASS